MDSQSLHDAHALSWKGDHPRIVFLHGFSGRASDFCGVARHLSNAMYAFDLFGHGPLTARNTPFTLNAQIESLSQTVTKDDILVGYSMGGRLALEAVCRANCNPKALILVGTSAGLTGAHIRAQRRQVDADRAKFIEECGVDEFLREWARTPLISTQERAPMCLRTLMKASRKGHTASGLSTVIRTFSPGEMPDRNDDLCFVEVPTLLIAGADDEKYLAIHQVMAEKIPRSQCESVDGSGHAPHLEVPHTLAQHISTFLDRLSANDEAWRSR